MRARVESPGWPGSIPADRCRFPVKTETAKPQFRGWALLKQLACTRDTDGTMGDKVAPYPMVGADYGRRIEMRPIANGMPVTDHDNRVIV